VEVRKRSHDGVGVQIIDALPLIAPLSRCAGDGIIRHGDADFSRDLFP